MINIKDLIIINYGKLPLTFITTIKIYNVHKYNFTCRYLLNTLFLLRQIVLITHVDIC